MKKISFLVAVLGIFSLSSSSAWSLVLPPTPVATPVPTPAPLNAPEGAFQVHTFANLDIGDSYFNLTNGGSSIASGNNGNICANVYALSADDTMFACCACSITPDQLRTYSVVTDLLGNPLTMAMRTSIVVKLVASTPNPKNSTSCNASSPTTSNLAPGLVAWGSNLHANSTTTPTTYAVTEQEFSYPTLSTTELNNLASQCHQIQTTGMGSGICSGCLQGGR